MAATPPTVPTSHNGIRPFVPVLDMNNIPLSKKIKNPPLFAKKRNGPLDLQSLSGKVKKV